MKFPALALLPLVLLLGGCATHRQQRVDQGIQESDKAEERKFFYDSWLPHKPTQEDTEYRKFFYDSWLNQQ
jgi:protein involved in sex pheromone biosynthesis